MEEAAQVGPVFLLKDSRIQPRGWAAHSGQLGLSSDLTGLMTELGATAQSTVFIDGIDKVNDPATQLTVNDLVRAIASDPALSNWKVLVTVREQNLDHIATWLDPDALRHLPIRSVTMSLLSSDELTVVSRHFPRLKALIMESGTADIILRRPFFLHAVLSLSGREGTASLPATEVELLNLWWRLGGADHPGFTHAQHRRNALLRLAERFALEPANAISIMDLPPEPLEDLKSAGVILDNPLTLFASRANSQLFIEQLDAILFEQKALADLSRNVRIVLNATNLNNGARFRFDNEDFGDYKTGYSYEVNHLPLALAVTASACFPGLFAPLKMDLRGYKFFKRDKQKRDADSPSAAPDFVHLSDGGIFDNLGYYSLINEIERGRDAFVLISDAANRFQTDNEEYRFFGALPRIKDILMQQVSNRDRRVIMERLLDESNKEWSGLYFKLESSCRWFRESPPEKGIPADLPEFGWSDSTVSRIAKIRTDLDQFSDAEVQALVYHGETATETTFARWHNDIYKKITGDSGYRPPVLPEDPEKRIFEGLVDSHKRIKRKLM